MKLTKIQKERRLKVLEVLYNKSPISRIDIAKETGITPATISDIIGQLIEEKLIHELGEESDSNKSGRKKILLTISNQHSFYMGIELSEKFFSFALCDNNGHLQEQKVIEPTRLEKNSLNDIFYQHFQDFLKQCSPYQPVALGIALPGHFQAELKKIQTNNPFWKDFSFDKVFELFNKPIYFSNNVECLAISERLFNPQVKLENFSILHVGRGMFCSSIYNGKLYGNENILVGEVGHIVVHPDGELCECGKRGCLQTYASEAWIIKKSEILYNNSETTYLRQLCPINEKLSVDTILNAYQLGDEGVINILHNAIKYLAITINNIAMMIDTHHIIIHGQLFDEPQLFTLLKEQVEKNIILLSSVSKQKLSLKPYHPTNGAIAACGLCVEQTLLR